MAEGQSNPCPLCGEIVRLTRETAIQVAHGEDGVNYHRACHGEVWKRIPEKDRQIKFHRRMLWQGALDEALQAKGGSPSPPGVSEYPVPDFSEEGYKEPPICSCGKPLLCLECARPLIQAMVGEILHAKAPPQDESADLPEPEEIPTEGERAERSSVEWEAPLGE